MIKKISFIVVILSLVFIGTAWAEDETVQSPECNPEILSCETLTPTPEPTETPIPTLTPTPTAIVSEYCSKRKCYILVDSDYYLMDEQPVFYDETSIQQILKENIEPITYEINELKRELVAQVEEKKPVLNKDNILYGIIGLLSLLTLIFGIKAFKKKK